MNKIYYPGMWPKRLSPTQRAILVNVRDGRPYGAELPKHGVEPALHVVMSNGLMQWGPPNEPPAVTPDGLRALEQGHYRDRNKDHARAVRYGKKRPPRPPNVQHPPLDARKLKLDSGVWRYTVSRKYVTVWTPAGRAIDIYKEAVAISICGCGEPYNCLPERAVTPGAMRHYIEQFLLDA